jgi:hypothetical protein
MGDDLSEAMKRQDRGQDGNVVQIKVKLMGVSKPPVWRRLQLDADTTLDRLHETILVAFGWAGYHLHVFQSGDEQFGVPEPELGLVDERRVSIGQLIGDVGDRLLYTYDLGDNWEHEIVVEELLDDDLKVQDPVLVAAKGACPPEDCGGRDLTVDGVDVILYPWQPIRLSWTAPSKSFGARSPRSAVSRVRPTMLTCLGVGRRWSCLPAVLGSGRSGIC